MATSTFTINDVPDPLHVYSLNAGKINLDSTADLNFFGYFRNPGVVTSQANSDLWAFGHLANVGRMDMAGNLHVGTATAAATVLNAAGATYAITGPADIRGGAAGSTFTNDGSVTRGGTGISDVTVALINNNTVSVTSGTMSFLAGVANGGAVSESGAVLTFAKAIGGTGFVDLSGGRVELAAGPDANQTFDFVSNSGVLALDAPGGFHGTIDDFAGSATIDLVKTPATSLSFSGGVLTVDNGSHAVAHLKFVGNYTTGNFALGSDGQGGSQISFV